MTRSMARAQGDATRKLHCTSVETLMHLRQAADPLALINLTQTRPSSAAAAGKPTPAKATPAAATRSSFKNAQAQESDVPVVVQLFKDIMPEDDKVRSFGEVTLTGFITSGPVAAAVLGLLADRSASLYEAIYRAEMLL